MSIPCEIKWIFQVTLEISPNHLNEQVQNANNSLESSSWKTSEIVKDVLLNPEFYSIISKALFHDNTCSNPIETLQANGYFYSQKSTFLSEVDDISSTSFLSFIQCFMWAYLDQCMPYDSIKRIIGRSKAASCTGAEALFCQFINTICQRHVRLPIISNINQHFFEFPHFRIVLYHFIGPDPRTCCFSSSHQMHYDDGPEINASNSLSVLSSLNIIPPFSPNNYKQSPLVIMCFLVDVVKRLSTMKPAPPPPAVSSTRITKAISSIEIAKRDILFLRERVERLEGDVHVMNQQLAKYKRPKTSLDAQRETTTELPSRPKTSLKGEKRVTWDIPNYVPSSFSLHQTIELEKAMENCL